MGKLSQVAIYTLAGVPAAIGVAFVARNAYVTADDMSSGIGSAFLLGMVAVGAYAGPAASLAVGRNRRRVAALCLWIVTLLAIATNWSLTLGALANRGAGVEAEERRLAAATRDDRARLQQLDELRRSLKFTPTTAEAVAAARAAVEAAERTRVSECGNGDPRARGTRCLQRETEEAQKRDVLTRATTDKAATDQATSIDAEAMVIRERLAKRPATKEGNASGEALGRLLPFLSPDTAATAQQGLVSLIVELLIAAALALPELLKKDVAQPGRVDRDEKRAQSPAPASIVLEAIAEPVIAPPPKPVLVTNAPQRAGAVPDMLASLLEPAKGQRVELEDVYKAYAAACKAAGEDPLTPEQFIGPLDKFCAECAIPTRTASDGVFLTNVRITGGTKSRRKALGKMAG